MSKLSIPTLVAALGGTLFLSACPGDDTTATGTETEGESTSTGTPPTTLPPTTTPPDDTTTVDPDTTVGVDDTSSSGTPPDTSTTTTGDDTTGTTGDDTTGTTSGSSSGESSSGESTESTTGDPPPPPMDGYGDCANFEEAVACLADEICIGDGTGNAVCLEQGCAAAGDCAVPATGDAVPTCLDVTDDGTNDCYLDCAMGETCPDGMVCVLDFVCIWELLPPPPPPPGICPDEDLGNAVPQSVMGDNTGLGEDWEPSCAPGGEDSTYQFTAPAAGSYTFDTVGSVGDTVLAVLDDCAGPELGCNDDIAMGNLQSEVTLPLVAGQTVIIVVDGFGGGVGPFTLNISQ